MVEFAYNNKKHTATQVLPFEVNYGLSPRMGFEGKRRKRFEAAEEFVEKMKQVQDAINHSFHQVFYYYSFPFLFYL